MTRVEEGKEGRRKMREPSERERYLLRVGGPLGGLQKWLARLVSQSVKKSKSRLARLLARCVVSLSHGCTQLDIRTDSPKSERAETEMESLALNTLATDAQLTSSILPASLTLVA